MSLLSLSTHFEALGFTLLHACWQGAIIAGLYKLFDMASPRLSHPTRYVVTLGALLALFAAVCLTLTYEELRLAQTVVATGSIESPAAPATPSFISRLLPWLDATWLTGVCVLSLRLFGGLWLIHRLQSAAIAVPEAIATRFEGALRRAGLTGHVRLRLHPNITGPFVVGAFKSIVYLPVSAVTALGVDQLDAVLAHELEHIRRADYLWNLVQSLIETLLFFHPAVWWLGAKLREQRELCCDDAALKTCRDPVTYATALLRLEEQRRITPGLAMALNGQGGGRGLVARIQRMLSDEAMPRGKGRPHAALALPVILIVLAAFITPAAQVAANAQQTHTVTHTLTVNENGHTYTIADNDPDAVAEQARAAALQAKAELARSHFDIDQAKIDPDAIAQEARADAERARADLIRSGQSQAQIDSIDPDAIAQEARNEALRAKADILKSKVQMIDTDQLAADIREGMKAMKSSGGWTKFKFSFDPDVVSGDARKAALDVQKVALADAQTYQIQAQKDVKAYQKQQKTYDKLSSRYQMSTDSADSDEDDQAGDETPAPLADSDTPDDGATPGALAPVKPPRPAAPVVQPAPAPIPAPAPSPLAMLINPVAIMKPMPAVKPMVRVTLTPIHALVTVQTRVTAHTNSDDADQPDNSDATDAG